MDSFLAECCIEKTDQQAKASTLYARYQQWCEARGENPVTQKVFGGWLRDRGFKRKRKKDGYHWLGIGLSEGNGEPSGEPSPRRGNEPERAAVILEWLQWLEGALQSDPIFARDVADALHRVLAGKPPSAHDVLNAARFLKTSIETYQRRVTHP